MAVESKPLFHPEVLRQQVRSFNLLKQTSATLPKLQHWASLISSGRADEFNETALLPEFLSDVFCGLLGYTGPAGVGGYYTLSRERHGGGREGRGCSAGPVRAGQGTVHRRP